MSKKRVLYILNPKSGIGKKGVIEEEIKARTSTDEIDYSIIRTTHRGHAAEIAEANRDKVDVIVAIGGDGTVNEVGRSLIGCERTALGIIPCGSGNGLARELDIPLRTSLAIDVINEANIRPIDVLMVDGNVSLNVAGIGFDAYISHLFANKKTRGPLQYMNLIAQEFPEYKPQTYTLDIEGHLFQRTAFLISFANSGQWGNNIRIAPKAKLDDGLMDVCMVSEFPNIAIPALLVSLLSQSIDQNKYDEIIRAQKVVLQNDEPIMGHVDGEPIMLGRRATIETKAMAIKVVTPSTDFFENTRFAPSKIGEQIISTVREPITNLRDNISQAHSNIRENISQASANIKENISQMSNDILDNLTQARDNIRDKWKDLGA